MTDETQVAETENPQAEDAQSEALSAEDRALTMGWTPKDQFKGDPEKWVDAETFVKRGEEFLPFLKANNRRLEQALDRAQKETAALKSSIDEVKQFYSKSEQRAYERARKDLEAELEQAAQAGDVEGVKSVTKDIAELERDIAKPKPEKAATSPDFDAFVKDNPWWEKDKALTAAAVAISEDVTRETGWRDGPRFFEEVAKRVKSEFPTKFENPNRRNVASVEGNTPTRKAGKTLSDLPPEARAIAQKWEKQGVMTTAEYLKNYQWD